MIFKTTLLLLVALLLPACAEFAAMKSAVGFYGAKSSDELLATNIWSICNAVPIGAYKRRFKTAEEIAAINILCDTGLVVE